MHFGRASVTKILIATFLVFFVSLTSLTVQVTGLDLKEQQERINQQIQDSQNLLQKKKTEESKALKELKSLNSILSNTESKLRYTEKTLKQAEEDLNYLELELEKTQTNLNTNTENLQERLMAMYVEGDVHILEVLLDSSSISDFLTRWDLMSRIAENDSQLIQGIREDLAVVEDQQRQVEEKKLSLLNLRQDQSVQKNQLQIASSRQKEVLKDAQSERASVEQVLDELEAESERIAAEIRKTQGNMAYQGIGKMSWPTPGYTRVTSAFGMRTHPILKTKRMHTGVDIGASHGVTIVAAESGKVLHVGWNGAYGRVVILDHGGDITTMYAHTSAALVDIGTYVKKGSPIAKVGSTGWSTGPHLHFEVRRNGNPVNPMNYLK